VLPEAFGVIGYVVAIFILTPGYQLFQAANNTAVMQGVDPGHKGAISGVLSLSRNLGLITGASAMGAVFAFASGASNVADAAHDAVASGMQTTFGVAAVLLTIATALAVGACVPATRASMLEEDS